LAEHLPDPILVGNVHLNHQFTAGAIGAGRLGGGAPGLCTRFIPRRAGLFRQSRLWELFRRTGRVRPAALVPIGISREILLRDRDFGKQQLANRGIGYQALDNGILSYCYVQDLPRSCPQAHLAIPCSDPPSIDSRRNPDRCCEEQKLVA
jgi:hypothetical protein